MDKTYTYPAYIKSLGRTLIVLSSILFGVLLVLSIDADTPKEVFLLGTLFLAAFVLFGWYIIRSNSVSYKLSPDGITVLSGRRQRFIPYGDITGVSHSSKTFVSIVLHSSEGNIAIRKNLVNYPEFAETLKPRIDAMRRDLRGNLQVKCKAWELYTAAGIFIAASAVIWIMVLIAAATDETGIPTAIALSVILLGFIAGLAYGILRYPRQYDFLNDRIIKSTLSGKTEYPASRISSVQYGQKKPKTYSRYGSPVLHFIEIKFSDQKKYIQIDQTVTDFPIDDIAEYVKKNYPVEGKFSEVHLGQK